MWLMTTQGFYSTVEHREDSALVLVRARAQEDLQNLERQLPGAAARIRYDADADYCWRLIATREEWTLAVARLIQEVDYDNFKSAVGRGKSGWDRERIYHRVWSALTAIEKGFSRRYYRKVDQLTLDRDAAFDSGADVFPFEDAEGDLFSDLRDLPELTGADARRLGLGHEEQSRSVNRSTKRRQQRKRAKGKKS